MTRRNSQARLIAFTSIAMLGLLSCAPFASADPLPGEVLKFYQSPLNGGAPGVYPVGAVPLPTDAPAPFLGHDELSTAYTSDGANYTGTMMADDFLDLNPNPIDHITFWGSYMKGTDPGTAALGVQSFRISLYTDIPASNSTGNITPSQPGQLIASQTVKFGALSPSSGTFSVTPVPPNAPGLGGQPGDSTLYEYNAELNYNRITFPDAFAGNTASTDPVEWLSIVALAPAQSAAAPLDWGWHDRDYGISDPYAPAGSETAFPHHLLDDAVQGNFSFIAGGGGVTSGGYLAQDYISAYDGISSSKDLAFALYTIVPEPASIGFLAVAGGAMLTRRRRGSV